ncbi:MAG TPA: hypothetical protein VNU46_04545, partial [Gemmatimonadaceae bacterium]|nr:hypothetical protein [Gemmatimonadaceae bacterium]
MIVPADDDAEVAVICTGSSPGTGTIVVEIGSMVSTITVTVPAAFALDTTTTNLTDQMLSLCANACFAGTTSYSTVPYYTLDTPRNVTLAYTEERAHPRPVVYADVLPIWATTYATQYTLQATLNGTKLHFVNGDTLIYFSGSTTTVRLAGQFDASAYTTGVYSLAVTVTGIFSGGATMPLTYSRPLIIVNEAASTIAKGWTIAGLQHLYIAGSTYLITDGTGSAVYFSGLGSQAADYTTLTYNSSGGYYVRAYPDSSHVYFSTTGQCLGSVDRLGFVTEYGYTGTQLTSIIDPERYLRGAGTYLSLAYGTYGLDSISEVAGSAGRTTNVTVASDGTLRTIK